MANPASRSALLTFTSLTGTPWLIFVSTAYGLYLNNQSDLHYRTELLLPFLAIFLGVSVIATFLAYLLRPERASLFLITYYLTGPLFMAYMTVKGLSLDPVIAWMLLASAVLLLTVLILLLRRKLHITEIAYFFSVLSLVFIGTDLLKIDNSIFKTAPSESATKAVGPIIDGSYHGPNIYHIIFDEYQTEMFQATLTRRIQKKLGGFIFYPEATTPFGRTGMALPAIFSGQRFQPGTPQMQYQRNAFESDQSMLHWLKARGYKTSALIFPIYDFHFPLFDEVTQHDEHLEYQPTVDDLAPVFTQLWTNAILPKPIASRIFNNINQQQLLNQNLLSPTAPLISMLNFRRIIEQEETFPATGRYTFVHLILPHFPYVLTDTCSYDPKTTRATPMTQSLCATNLIIEFVDKMTDLARFEQSMIIIQSDHGARFALDDGHLLNIEHLGYDSIEWNTARSRPLLMIKPPGVTRSQPFHIAPNEASLVDVAPTIANALNLDAHKKIDGIDLLTSASNRKNRVRYYHFFERKGDNDWTDEMQRFRIEHGKMTFDRVVHLTRNTGS